MAKRIITKIGDIFCVEVDNDYKGASQRDRYLGMTAAMTQIPVPTTRLCKLEETIKSKVDGSRRSA